MIRFLAVVGLVAFVAACSDANVTSPVTHTQPQAASRDGDPPPPPINPPGTITGDLDVFGSGLVPAAATPTTTSNSVPTCSSGHNFFLVFTFSYFMNKTGTNEVAHMDMTGGLTGGTDVHQNTNGSSNANGTITSSDGFTFNIQGGDGTIQPTFDELGHVNGMTFDFSVTGLLTDPSGHTCQASAELTTNAG